MFLIISIEPACQKDENASKIEDEEKEEGSNDE
jgi:hypothetical protein